jgi:hypothetical protein
MLHPLVAALAAVTVPLALTPIAAPAAADPGDEGTHGAIPSSMADAGRWMNRADPGFDPETSTDAARWSYPDYPLACLPSSTSGPAVTFLWALPASLDIDDSQWRPYSRTHAGQFREQVRRAASLYAASSSDTALTETAYADDRAPRFTTWWSAADRQCYPTVDVVRPPDAAFRADPMDNAGPEVGLFPWLAQNGYGDPDRKYVVMVPKLGSSGSSWHADLSGGNYTGQTYAVNPSQAGYHDPATGVAGPDTRPASTNLRCQSTSYVLLGMPNGTTVRAWDDDPLLDPWSSRSSVAAYTIAHELGHTICAGYPDNPDGWSPTQGHPLECPDIMAYCDEDWSDEGQTWNSCTTRGVTTDMDRRVYNTRFEYRFDCNHDGYWARRGPGEERPWSAERWSASDSRFLWGAPDPFAGPAWNVAQEGFDFP